jgi:hypothetical protein
MNDVFEKILAIIVVVAAVALLTAFPTMLLWNWLMPSIFELRQINFWEALGICFLAGTLFQSHGGSKKE